MSPLNIFLPGWTTLPTAIPDEPLTQEPPVCDSADWSAAAANEAAEHRYTGYCDKKYDATTEPNLLADG